MEESDMLRSSLGRITSCLLAGLTLALGAPASHAAPKPEKINFDTADKVQLVGTFYGSDKGKKAPCALMIHNIGNNRNQEGWKGLAEKLQERGVAVLMFDFRGHGDSTTVQQDFWRLKANLTLKGANPKKTEISFKDFPPSYYPMLVNDIAAAKREVDKRNDAHECNSADLLVVGREE